MTLINDFLSLIYPRHCEACANSLFKHENYICNHCKLSLPKSNYHKIFENELVQTFAGRVPLEKTLCFYMFEKSGKVQKLLHAIKYQDQKELASFIGELYANDLEKENTHMSFDLILPIPLHKQKLKVRGYNQSEWFAKGLAKENVEGIFNIKDRQTLVNKHILLVDDVITTGATIEAAWMALKDIEGIKVSVASIAFASRK